MFLLSLNVLAAENSFSWYCVRNKDHKQPGIANELSFTEDYDLYWIDKKHVNFDNDEKIVYLTFDAGYENGNINKILDTLRENDVKACFFILDNLIYKNADLVKRMIADGHTVANHTMKHKNMTKCKSIDEFKKELETLEILYKETFGVDMPKIYRPPEGRINRENLEWAKELGYKTVMWSFAYADWDNDRQPSQQFAMKKVLENLHNGEVMLLHPTSSTNAQIMDTMIKELRNKGFKFGCIEELCSG